jgi:hypothetical protein
VALQNDAPSELYIQLTDYVPSSIVKSKNRKKEWKYGYDKTHDLVVISKDGTIGDIVDMNGVRIALPKAPNNPHKRHEDKLEQYWEPEEYPKALKTISTIFQWNEMPGSFQDKWSPYIDREFDRREEGFWFMNKGEPTYITGSHYMYLQWTKIDIGLPDFRESNRWFFIYWEAAKADDRCFGICYLKNRRSGFSFMSSGETVNQATISSDARFGILSKTGSDAKKMFTDKVVPMSINYPFFFKPIQDGMDRPKMELAYRVPSAKLTRKGIGKVDAHADLEGLDTTIDWKNTADNSYDGEKLKLLVHDESGKWEKPENIKNNWRVTKTCLRLGRKIIGKCMMGSTSNALDKGGANFKSIYEGSDPLDRNANGQTKSGLYKLFIPMEHNMEGFIDKYGHSVFHDPHKPLEGIDGDLIETGVLTYWNNEVDALKSDPDALNEFLRQFPRTESHAFRDESKNTLFNISKIYEQIDYNDSFGSRGSVMRGDFFWKNGERDTEVIWSPNPKGRFYVNWVPSRDLQNNVIRKDGKYLPGNDHIGSFGCDSYDISGVVNGGGSKGSLHGMTKFHMEDAPVNEFFLEYVSRPPTAEIFYEDVLMALHFYGMPMLAENNKPRLLYYLKDRGYRKFSINRPDKSGNQLSKAEKELGGIPSSTPVITAHAEVIEAYIQSSIGIVTDDRFGDIGSCKNMPFNRTLLDWANYNINNRTRFDATVSSGFAIMANQSRTRLTQKNDTKISLNFAKYSNKGFVSEIIKR